MLSNLKTQEAYFLAWRYSQHQKGLMIVSLILTIPLGLLASLMATAVGPALQVLIAPATDTPFLVEDLVGPRLAAVWQIFGGSLSIAPVNLHGYLPWALLALAGTKTVFLICLWYLWERIGESMALRLRQALVDGFLRLSPQKRMSQGGEEELAALMASDCRYVREFLVRYYGGLPREIVQIAFMGITIVLLAPDLCLIFLLGVLPVVFFTQRFAKKLKRRAQKALEDFSSVTEWLQQRLLGVETIKHLGTEVQEQSKFANLIDGLRDKQYRAARLKARSGPSVEAIAIVAIALVLGFALWQISTGHGQGAVYLSFFANLGFLSQSAGKLGRYLNVRGEGNAASQRLGRYLTVLEENRVDKVQGAILVASQVNRLEVKNLTTGYHRKNPAVINNFSYQFLGGSSYAITGPSGCGKSTLMRTLLGTVTPWHGKVLLFHKPQNSSILYLPQSLSIPRTTIEQVVCYPSPCPENPDHLLQSLNRVGLKSWLHTLEQGTRTVVGDGALTLSGGQKQRLLMARLFYHRAGAIIMDEGTSALDSEIEQEILLHLDDLKAQGIIIILVAHRQSTIKWADEIVSLKAVTS